VSDFPASNFESAFDFEGAPVPARPGDTIAAAMTRAGLATQRRTRAGEDRGIFCGMGLCQECLVEVDGRSAQRACMTPASGVATVRRHRDGEPAALARLAPVPTTDALPCEDVDLAIVGGGPAGISAALAAVGHGLAIVLIDERSRAGGQYFKPVAGPHDPADLDAQHRAGEQLRDRLAQSDVRVLAGHSVWHARAEGQVFELGLYGDGQARLLHARALILATGAYERPPLVPGWTLPGVMTVGAAQGLVRSHGVAPGRRVVIAGHGPLGLQLAMELVRAGTPPLALLERARPSRAMHLAQVANALRHAPRLVAEGLRLRAELWRAGVPVLEGWEVERLSGQDRVAALVARRIGTDDTREFAVDTVCVGEGFLPQAELARALGCACTPDPVSGFLIPVRDDDCAASRPGIWIAGDGGGLGGAQVALAQGELAGLRAVARLGGESDSDKGRVRDVRMRLSRAKSFQRALWAIYDAPPRKVPPSDETILCRCESVSHGTARAAIESGASDLGALKRLTRLGMGRCQGRYCSGPAARMTGEASLFAPQTPARPVPAAAIAVEKPEWGGHRRTETPRLRAPDSRFRERIELPARVDLAIIGAGIMGTAAALRATELGLDTVVLDRGTVNGESSGGNAGSLHLQLLSFDFGQKTGGRGKALLETLPLQRDAIALWQQLERDLGTSFEITLTGGMMLAEEEGQIAFLRDKVAAERAMGIEVEVIGREEIAALAPGVSPRMIAAAWCPGEGKINPLLGTPAIARAAIARGARFFEGVQITALEADGSGQGFHVETSAGSIHARRLILAAGGWTGALGAMLGVPLPVHGAPLQMVVTETAPPLASCLLAHSDRHLTMKQATAGNLIIGGAWSAAADPETGRTRILRESLEGNLWVAERVLPGVAGLHVLRSWAAMNVDIDGAPLVGALPGMPGCVVVAGANGYTLGPLLGRAAADAVASGRLAPELETFSTARLAALA
jgi:glycine/D-amino acid oxidase-like deaminating enzyme